jgi:hypothetical protein
MTETRPTPNTRVEIADDVLVQAIEDAAVTLNPEKGLYYDPKDSKSIAEPTHVEGRFAPLLPGGAAQGFLLLENADVQD